MKLKHSPSYPTPNLFCPFDESFFFESGRPFSEHFFFTSTQTSTPNVQCWAHVFHICALSRRGILFYAKSAETGHSHKVL